MSDAVTRLSTALAGRYRIERELGAGGMATVYLAHDLKHDRKVAIKVLKPELAAVLGAERFVHEIRTTASLQHPHILPLFDSGKDGGFLFYVMPYVEGESLRARLDRETQLGIADAVQITRDVADALDYAHRHSVIHRDIKPENILLHDGRPIVADFGIALAVSAAAGGRITESGFTVGTPTYMSPEQATAEKELTNRSDIYSLGCVLYEMLTGTPPHTGVSAQQIIMKIVTDEPVPATKLRKAVPPNISAAVTKALEKIPADRFERANAFADALASPTFTTLRSAAEDVVIRERRWSRDPRSIGLTSVAAVASVALLWALTRPMPASPQDPYDVGLADSATMTTEQGVGFAVAPSGDFVVYQASGSGAGGLWYHSLHTHDGRRIDRTERGTHPAISPDGKKLAFLRFGAGHAWTLEWMFIAGGPATVVGRGVGDADLAWSTNERLQVVDMEGRELRWIDVVSSTVISRKIQGCILPFPMPDEKQLLCGSGGPKAAYLVSTVDTAPKSIVRLWTGGRDSTRVIGTHFRLLDERYLVYLSVNGDLLAAPVELKTHRVGRSVALVSGVARRGDTGVGAYDLTASGTLVYAQGANHAVGNLVAIDEHSVDTLKVGQAAFRLFSPSPDETRLAAVVSPVDGDELRVYNLRTGDHDVLHKESRIQTMTLPVWSPRGDRLIFGAVGPGDTADDLFATSPDQFTASELVYHQPGQPILEAFAWGAGDRVIVEEWMRNRILSLDLKSTPPSVVRLADSAGYPSLSPDGRSISYSTPGGNALWLQAISENGKRYRVAGGDITSSHWLSPTELTFAVRDSGATMAIDRITIDFSGPRPVFSHRRRWLALPDFVPAQGPPYALTRSGRVVYLRGAPERPVPYLSVIPDLVSKMKRLVDDANPGFP